ncbi:hypothetical protein [Sphingomonas sp. AX6]|uniref:hypothetical protein n=1 Tax=Sphingomonas sp. AX6 TaxID=2653171 RepID=UPI0012EF2884|nr:hypothetical protein [Sphingomonas sp. AX6]VXD01771.1 conserved hypothetical protein [Sphingomonas sp. AX6]
MRQIALILSLALATACERAPDAPPPANLSFEGLPVTGDLDFARSAGFARCMELGRYLRCRREGVEFGGGGSYHAAVDALGNEGASGFHEVSLWSETDQSAMSRIGNELAEQGWDQCRTGQEDRGDQRILTKAGSPVRVSIDITYWGKRRLRILPERGQPTGRCW